MGYFDPQSMIKKIATETGISNVAPKASVRAQQPAIKKQTAAQKAAAKKKKEQQYFIDMGEEIPPHLK